MDILNNYNNNKENILYSQFSDVENDRKKVVSNFSSNYFNKKNNESLKNVKLEKFLDLKYKYILSDNSSISKKNVDETYSIVLVNGQCKNLTDENIEVSNLTCENSKDYFNNNLSKTNDFFIDLNSLFLNSGFKIKVKKNKKVNITISNIVSEEELTVFQKNFILCEEGSSLDLIEEYENSNNSINNVFSILELKEKALLQHSIIQDNSDNHDLIFSTFSNCYKESSYYQRVYNFSEGYVRNFHFSDLNDINSSVDLKGYFFLKDSNTSNNKTFVKHLAGNCKSNQIYKGILNNNSKASYYSNTHVDSVAQKTEGYQLSKGILLSENASYFSKPELKIYADDVKCSHGSTIGPIDENAIFYLRSRGMTKKEATKILVSSFVNEDLNNIKNIKVSEIVQKKLITYLNQLK